MFWQHDLHRRRVECTKERDTREGEFEAQLIAKRVDGSWFRELIPLYPYDERSAALDGAIAAMVQNPFDPNTQYGTAD